MESTTELIQQLIASSASEEKLEILQRLRVMAGDRGFVIANVKRLFNELKSLISNFSVVTIPAIEFITTLVVTTKDPEVYAQIPDIYPLLISSLESTNSLLVAAINSCIYGCIHNNIGLESFLSSIQGDGLSSDNSITRSNSGELLTVLAKRCPQLIDDSKYASQLIRVLEDLIKRSSEFSVALTQLTQTHPGIYRLSKRLHASFKKEYMNFLAKENIKVDESDPKIYKEIDDAITAEISKKFTFAENFEMKTEGFRYGVVPERLITDLGANSNWKQRAGAIEELEETINNLKSSNQLKPYISPFIQYLVTLLNDPNYKVAITTLQILNKLLKTYLELIKPETVDAVILGLIEKFGDNKVMIRQLAVTALRFIGKIADPINLINTILPYLTCPKWHTREEILNFLIIFFIENSNGPDSSKFFSNIPYSELVQKICPLLLDDKPKVVQMAFEAYATISHFSDSKRILTMIQNCTSDEELLSRVRYRLEAEAIPILNVEGVLEFPYISSELLTQNSFYSGTKGKTTAGKGCSRFTSAGPVNRIPERNLSEVHSAIRRPQTNNTLVIFY